MSTSVSTKINARLPMPLDAKVTPSQWRVLVEAIHPTAKSSESVLLALEYCRVRNLDPFKRPVHIVPMWSKTLRREVETVWPGISELETTAARTGAWAGMDPPEWGPMAEYSFKSGGGTDEYGEALPGKDVVVKVPESCMVTVYRNVDGRREAFAEPVYWIEAYARAGRGETPNYMWLKRPRGQLHKCAKAASLRAAFPEDIGGQYAAEEMEGKVTEGGGPVIENEPVNDKAAVKWDEAVEESEFTVRAEQTLGEAAGKSASAWLKAFIAVMAECPTMADHNIIIAFPAVPDALAKAPSIVRAQIKDAIQASEKRLAEAKPDAVPAPPTVEGNVEHI